MSRIRFLFRQDSADAWTSNNPTLAAGEIGVELDSAGGVSPKFKIGNGILAWNDSSFNYFINDSDQSALAGAGGAGAAATWYGDRGLTFGGYQNNSSNTNTISYFDITTPGNAADFGDLTIASQYCSAGSDTTYGVSTSGFTGANVANGIDYITIATTSNAQDFGDLTVSRHWYGDAAYNSTYILWAGGYDYPDYNLKNEIDYVTTATPSNATDFGDLTAGNAGSAGTSNETYGIFAGGYTTTNENKIDYVTIATPSNATDFGDLNNTVQKPAGTSNGTYGLIAGGYNGSNSINSIDYLTIASPSNATDFGDLTTHRFTFTGTYNSTYSVFTGGRQWPATYINVMDYVVTATPGNATDFGDMLATSMAHGSTSGSPS